MRSFLKGLRRSVALVAGGLLSAGAVGCGPEAGFSEEPLLETASQPLASAVSVGLHARNLNTATLSARESALGSGARFDHVLLFHFIHWDASGLSNRVQPFLNAGRDVVINLEFQEDKATYRSEEHDGNLAEIANGYYDTKIDAFAAELRSLSIPAGRKVSVRTLHEMNGNWYVWAINHDHNGQYKNTATLYKSAWWRVHGKLPTWVKMQLNYNGVDVGRAVDWSAIYPGDTNVDMVLFTKYNRYGLDSPTWEVFGPSFDGIYNRAMAEGLGNKPFGLSETSATPHPTEVYKKKGWFTDMAKTIVSDYPNLKEVTFFLEDKSMDGELRCWDWAYATSGEDPSGLSCASGATRSAADKDGIRQAMATLQAGGGGGTTTTWYELKAGTGELLTGKNLDNSDNTRPTAAPDGGTWGVQAWNFISTGDGYFKLQNKYEPTLYLTGKDENGSLTLPVNTTAQVDQGINSQKWQMVGLASGGFQLKNLSTGGCLSTKSASGDLTTDYRRVAVHSCDTTWSSQQWTRATQ